MCLFPQDWICWPIFCCCLVPHSLTVIPASLPNRFSFHPSIFPVQSVLPACRSLTTDSIFLSHQPLCPPRPLLLAWPHLSWLSEEEKANPLCTRPCPAARQTGLEGFVCAHSSVGGKCRTAKSTLSKTHMKLRSTDHQQVSVNCLGAFGICTV